MLGAQKQKHKKQPWSKVECFAFGGSTVRFASLETSFHAANHTIPPPPSHEGYPHCPKDKNRSPFHCEKPLMITWIIGKKPCQMVDIQYDITIIGGREVSRPYQMEGRVKSVNPSWRRVMPLICFDANSNVSTHWKHAEGMSLRYGVVVLGDF